MRAITYTEARNNLAAELDRVANDCDVTIITRQKAEAGVLISLKEYQSLMETAHLLRLSSCAGITIETDRHFRLFPRSTAKFDQFRL